MAPELFEERPLYNGFASDIWALGATLFCLVVGHPPFMANTSSELEALLRGPVEPAYPKDLLPSLRNLLRRMLTKLPANRITLPDILAHPWVTCEGTDLLPRVHYIRVTDPDAESLYAYGDDTAERPRVASTVKSVEGLHSRIEVTSGSRSRTKSRRPSLVSDTPPSEGSSSLALREALLSSHSSDRLTAGTDSESHTPLGFLSGSRNIRRRSLAASSSTIDAASASAAVRLAVAASGGISRATASFQRAVADGSSLQRHESASNPRKSRRGARDNVASAGFPQSSVSTATSLLPRTSSEVSKRSSVSGDGDPSSNRKSNSVDALSKEHLQRLRKRQLALLKGHDSLTPELRDLMM
jgi:serine/threonine protein kinase